MSAGATTGALTVRPAGPDDATAVATIYNQGIEDRLATLETQLRSADERREWMAARGPRHPVIVAEADGAVVGWGSLNSFNPRPAYDHVADLSVYIERAWRGRGVGRRLIERLVTLGREIGYHKIVLARSPSTRPAWRSTGAWASPPSACTTSRACSTAAGWTSS